MHPGLWNTIFIRSYSNNSSITRPSYPPSRERWSACGRPFWRPPCALPNANSSRAPCGAAQAHVHFFPAHRCRRSLPRSPAGKGEVRGGVCKPVRLPSADLGPLITPQPRNACNTTTPCTSAPNVADPFLPAGNVGVTRRCLRALAALSRWTLARLSPRGLVVPATLALSPLYSSTTIVHPGPSPLLSSFWTLRSRGAWVPLYLPHSPLPRPRVALTYFTAPRVMEQN